MPSKNTNYTNYLKLAEKKERGRQGYSRAEFLEKYEISPFVLKKWIDEGVVFAKPKRKGMKHLIYYWVQTKKFQWKKSKIRKDQTKHDKKVYKLQLRNIRRLKLFHSVKIEIRCDHCHELFEKSRSFRKKGQAYFTDMTFCSVKCFHQYYCEYRKKNPKIPNEKYILRICKNCEKEEKIIQTKDASKFCSPSCLFEYFKKGNFRKYIPKEQVQKIIDSTPTVDRDKVVDLEKIKETQRIYKFFTELRTNNQQKNKLKI